MNNHKIINQSLQVKFEFNLLFTHKIFNTDNTILVDILTNKTNAASSKAIVVIDSGVTATHNLLKQNITNYFNHHADNLSLEGVIIDIPGGEQSKNDETHVKTILQAVNNCNIDRHSYIIAIGGGALLDTVGFAAAIAHRGVRLIRIPTTVLSQNDSGIGVKNGINYFGKKNFVGSFAVPYAVINDDHFLTTLDSRDWRSGISEALKVALIKDYTFFEWIENHTADLNNRDRNTMNDLIYRCADLHMKHIKNSGDAFEQGSSRPLDFGHWAAHKLEQLSHYEIRHGEAVAMGIAIDSTYSHLKGYLSAQELNRVLKCMTTLGFNISHEQINEDIIKGLEEFREHLGGQLTIMLLKSLGTGIEVHDMDTTILLESITFLSSYKK